jgi:fumarate reductase subunit C
MSSPTRTLPARTPDGWWAAHPRYRTYVLFAATGIVLVLVNTLLLLGVHALATGVAAWESYLASLASIPGGIVVIALLVGTLFFALRWLRVGSKIPGVLLGNLQSSSIPLIMVGHFTGFVTITLVVILLLSGVVV